MVSLCVKILEKKGKWNILLLIVIVFFPLFSKIYRWPVFYVILHTNTQALHNHTDLRNTSVHTPIHLWWRYALNSPWDWLLSTLMHSNTSIPTDNPRTPLWRCSFSMMKPLLVPISSSCVGTTLRVLGVLCLCVSVCVRFWLTPTPSSL